jgi:Protein O-mannosyl-transferase TMEM260-like
MSATLGALSIGGLYLIMIQFPPAGLAGRRVAAALPALVFAFGSTIWSQAVIAEVYAPNLAFIALTLLCLLHWERTRRDRDFFLFALVFGLSLGIHLSDLGFAPAFALFILLTDWRVLLRPKWWLAGLAGFGVGVAQFLWISLQVDRVAPQFLLGKRSPRVRQVSVPTRLARSLSSSSRSRSAPCLSACSTCCARSSVVWQS